MSDTDEAPPKVRPQTFNFDVLGPLTKLLAGLMEAEAAFRHKDSRKDHGRVAAHGVVLALVRFVEAMPEWGRFGALDALNAALIDVHNGVPSPMFTPAPTGRRGKDPIAYNILKLHAAVIMELHMRAGADEKTAARKTSALLHSRHYRQRAGLDKPITAATVIGWRNQHTGASPGCWPDCFRSLMRMADAKPPKSSTHVDIYARELLRRFGPKI
jgi:hypothetical protein